MDEDLKIYIHIYLMRELVSAKLNPFFFCFDVPQRC